MSKSLETNYSGEEFLDKIDEVDGMALTLEGRVDSYLDSLGSYITEDLNVSALENEIDSLVYTLEMVYDSLDSLDIMIEDENMIARIERDGKKGICDLEDNLARISNGAYKQIESFRDALTLIHYVDEGDIQADIGSFREEDVSAPTQLVADRDRLKDISRRLDREYNRIIFAEVQGRRHLETQDGLDSYSPEPPIFRMLGHEEHAERVNFLNKQYQKNK